MERTQQPLSVGQKKNKTQAQAKQSAVPTAPHKDQRSKRSKKPQPQSAQAPAQAGMTQPRAHTGLQPMSAQQAAALAMASTPVAQQPRMTMSKTTKTVKKAAANHILVVAHPSAQAQQVFDLLKAAGVQEALPSRREQLSAQALTETLLKAHGLQWSNGQVPTSIESVEASPMWQSLVLDLVLGNMEQPLWAWLDPQAVHLLDFWQQQSEHTVFMLVYDDIHNIYQQCLQSGAEASPESINAKVQSWVAYNEALLQFHLRNPERSFLVHAKQVAQSAQSYVQQINQRVAAPLQLAAGHSTAAEQPTDAVEQPNSQLASMGEPQNLPSATTQPGTEGLTNWLIEQLVNTQSDALQLYEALQAAANLPLAQPVVSAPAASAAALQQAWASFAAAQLQYRSNCQQVQNLQHQLQAQAQTMAEAAQQKQGALQAQLKDAEEENALLLEQLHKVQEELEKLYLQGKEDKKNLENIQAEVKKLNVLITAEQEKNKVIREKFVQDKEVQKTYAEISELKEENILILNQLHKVQEQLEFYYAENERLKGLSKDFSEIDCQKLSIRYQLPYRLGATMIQNSKSICGWLKMPFALRGVYKKSFDFEIKPINDAEEKSLKQHLSYKLGICMIENSKSKAGWFLMPWYLLKEVRRFKKSKNN